MDKFFAEKVIFIPVRAFIVIGHDETQSIPGAYKSLGPQTAVRQIQIITGLMVRPASEKSEKVRTLLCTYLHPLKNEDGD